MNWTLVRVIGKGGSSTVYKAELVDPPPSSSKYVAIKQIDTDAMNSVQIESIRAEIRMMKDLSHPSIVQYYGMQEQSDRIFIAMEYATYGSLRQFYQRHGALLEAEAVYCLQQIIQGLNYLHSNGFAHRDIKCANCLLFQEGRVKLADFGASKRYESESIVSGLKGTPNWMAPEVIKGIQMTTGWLKADVWSLGCSLVEMLTAKMPYAEYENPMTAMYRIASGEAPKLPDGPFSAELVDFLQKCCAMDPDTRPPAQELAMIPLLQTIVPTPMRLFTNEVASLGDGLAAENDLGSHVVDSLPSINSQNSADSLQPGSIPGSTDSVHDPFSPRAGLLEVDIEDEIPEDSAITPAVHTVAHQLRSYTTDVEESTSTITRQFSALAFSREGTAVAQGRGGPAVKCGLDYGDFDGYERDFVEVDPDEDNNEVEETEGKPLPHPRGTDSAQPPIQATTEVIRVSSTGPRPHAPLTGELLTLSEPTTRTLPSAQVWQQVSIQKPLGERVAVLPPVKESIVKVRKTTGTGRKAPGKEEMRGVKAQTMKTSAVSTKSRKKEASQYSQSYSHPMNSSANTSVHSTGTVRSYHATIASNKSLRSFSAGVYGNRTQSKYHRGMRPGVGVKLPGLVRVNNEATEQRYVQSAPAISRSVNLPPLSSK